ncbi:MAG TPA: response regulator [Nitrospiraceae bacterium]|nr:response regulator [Nitrospiraceae bacterium]
MANVNDVIEDIHESDHLVQFYEQDAFLVEQAVNFITAPSESDHTGIIIATQPHHEAMQQRLAASLTGQPASSSRRRIIALDARATLEEIMVLGHPHQGRFTDLIGRLIDQATQGGSKPVRVFGEMVALLWADGKHDAALQLEELWNQLGAVHRFSLLCAYPIQGFSRSEDTVRFAGICGLHSVVRPTESFLLSKSTERVHRVVAHLQLRAQILQAEIARREEAERTLRRREQDLSDFLENAAEGLHQVGPDGTILWANKAELDLLGYQPDEYIGHHIAEFHADAGTIDDVLKRLLQGETLYDYPARLRCKDGTVKDVLIHSNALWEDGRFIHTRCFTRDVTERRRIEEELDRRVAARTRELVLSQNKLRALASQLSLAEQRVRKEVATELHDYLAQLLIVLRMKLFKADQQAKDTTLAGLLHEADRVLDESIMYTRSLMADLTPPILQFGLVMSLRWLAEKFRRHNLTVDVRAEPVHMDLTEDQIGLLFQSVRELLMNVVKHAKTDKAQVSVQSNGQDLTLEVSDAGQGFRPSTRPSSFPGQDAGQFGLFSIRERMEALGGRFAVESTPGCGTRVILMLPYGSKRPNAAAPTVQGLAGLTGVPVPKREGATRILLVDDHAMVRQGLRGILDGYQDLQVIGEAADGQEAVDLAHALSPDVVVMDVNLPKIDGVEATKLIKARRPSTVVIGLSVHQANQIQHMFKEAGAAGYVTKDAAADSLHEAIIGAVGAKGPAVPAEESLACKPSMPANEFLSTSSATPKDR